MAKPIYAAWTDSEGCGPDMVILATESFPPTEIEALFTSSELQLHRAFHLVVTPDPTDSQGSLVTGQMFNGQFSFREEAATELYQRLATWLGSIGARS